MNAVARTKMDKIGCIQGKMRLPFVISMQAATPYTVLFRWDVVPLHSEHAALRQQQKRRPTSRTMVQAVKPEPATPFQLAAPLSPHDSTNHQESAISIINHTMNNIVCKTESELLQSNKSAEQLGPARVGDNRQFLPMSQVTSQSHLLVGRLEHAGVGEDADHKDGGSDSMAVARQPEEGGIPDADARLPDLPIHLDMFEVPFLDSSIPSAGSNQR